MPTRTWYLLIYLFGGSKDGKEQYIDKETKGRHARHKDTEKVRKKHQDKVRRSDKVSNQKRLSTIEVTMHEIRKNEGKIVGKNNRLDKG